MGDLWRMLLRKHFVILGPPVLQRAATDRRSMLVLLVVNLILVKPIDKGTEQIEHISLDDLSLKFVEFLDGPEDPFENDRLNGKVCRNIVCFAEPCRELAR